MKEKLYELVEVGVMSNGGIIESAIDVFDAQQLSNIIINNTKNFSFRDIETEGIYVRDLSSDRIVFSLGFVGYDMVACE